MHIFLSWSGNDSKSYATAFKKLLENVIQGVEGYISTDNKKGRSWYAQIIENEIVQKIWNFCHTLRDDGVGYGDYTNCDVCNRRDNL